MAGGSETVLQLGPPAVTVASTKIPAAWAFSVIVRSVSGAQPWPGRHCQLLLITCGRRAGFGFWPSRSVGAMKNWKHSVYVAGVPTPWFMLRQPIHFAPGATPIWFPASSSPIEVPVVWLPWPLSSHGSRRLGPHEPPPEWIASHQL